MQKLMSWLADEAKGTKQIAGYIFLAALINVALNYTVRAALENWGIVEVVYDPDPQNPFLYYNLLAFVSLLVQAPLFEETIFRLVPLTLVVFFTKEPKVVLGTVVFFAVFFGAVHPYSLIGQTQVAIGGLVFGVVFLKAGGLQDRTIKAWMVAMAAHAASNLFVLGVEYYDYLARTLPPVLG